MNASNYIGRMAVAAILLSFFSVSGCDNTSPNRPESVRASAKIAVGGTVVFRESGNGFYGILADNGGQYEPVNLDPKFRTDGEHISFTGTLDTTTLGEHHWGNPIELASVSAVK